MKGKINYAKGVAFEQKFSIYMVKELGYNSFKRRVAMTGSDSIKGSEADIIGVMYNQNAEKIRKIGMILLIISLILFAFVAFEKIHQDFLYICLLFGVSGFIYGIISKKLFQKHTWVECKNRKTMTDLRMVRDFYNAVQDYNNSKDKKYGISKMIFVSASGFVDNALQFAAEKGIDCYRLTSNKFEKIDY